MIKKYSIFGAFHDHVQSGAIIKDAPYQRITDMLGNYVYIHALESYVTFITYLK